MQDAGNSLEFAVKIASVMKNENIGIVHANTQIYAFLFKSTQFIINNFPHVDYAHGLIIKSDEISMAENLTGF